MCVRPLQVFLQYSEISAWVPAGFSVPRMLPKLSDFKLGKKKDDKPMRQVKPLSCCPYLDPKGNHIKICLSEQADAACQSKLMTFLLRATR